MDGLWARLLKNNFAPVTIDRFDCVVGNPPWVNWESLPDGYRQASKPVWIRYGLFPHGGMDTILGKGKKDIATLMTYVVADRLLKPRGRLGFVITQSVFKTSGAGQGFRRLSITEDDGKETSLGVVHVDDMVDLNPFEGASNRTAVFVLYKGSPRRRRVPYTVWRKKRGARFTYESTLAEVERATKRLHFDAEPVDEDDLTSPWLTASGKALDAIRKVLGNSDYVAHEGVNTGGANAVYWVDVVLRRPDGLMVVQNITEGARVEAEQVRETIEADLLYPLLRGRDVQRWRASPAAHILMVQDPVKRRGIDVAELQQRFPRTHAYLKQFEGVLRARAALTRYFTRKDKKGIVVETGPFYSMFNVGDYTFAPWKVVWREVAHTLDAAVAGPDGDRPILPDHTLISVECGGKDEAHYLCAALNSSPAKLAVEAYIVLHPDPHVLERVRIPRFNPADSTHLRLAQLSDEAHGAARAADSAALRRIEAELDRQAAPLWGLTDEQLAEIQRSLLVLNDGAGDGDED